MIKLPLELAYMPRPFDAGDCMTAALYAAYGTSASSLIIKFIVCSTDILLYRPNLLLPTKPRGSSLMSCLASGAGIVWASLLFGINNCTFMLISLTICIKLWRPSHANIDLLPVK